MAAHGGVSVGIGNGGEDSYRRQRRRLPAGGNVDIRLTGLQKHLGSSGAYRHFSSVAAGYGNPVTSVSWRHRSGEAALIACQQWHQRPGGIWRRLISSMAYRRRRLGSSSQWHQAMAYVKAAAISAANGF